MKEITNLLRREVLYWHEGRPTYPHPWELLDIYVKSLDDSEAYKKFSDRRAVEIVGRIGTETISLPIQETELSWDDFYAKMREDFENPLRTCSHAGCAFSTRDWNKLLDHREKEHGDQFPGSK